MVISSPQPARPRVLITGASGRIGRAVAEHLANRYDIVGLDLSGGRWTTQIGSITHPATVDRLCAGVEAVVHCAAFHAPHLGSVARAKFVETNVGGTECLLQACLRHRVRRFVYTSTTSLYGAAMAAADRAVWVDEALAPIPRDVYDETKIAAEEACAAAARDGLACVSLRMSRCFPEALRLVTVYRLYRGVDARDVAAAHGLALDAPVTGFEVFNISAQSPFSHEEMGELHADAARVIGRHFPWAEAEFARRGWKLPRSIDRVYAIDKAVAELGYRPRYNFPSLFASGDSSNPGPGRASSGTRPP